MSNPTDEPLYLAGGPRPPKPEPLPLPNLEDVVAFTIVVVDDGVFRAEPEGWRELRVMTATQRRGYVKDLLFGLATTLLVALVAIGLWENGTFVAAYLGGWRGAFVLVATAASGFGVLCLGLQLRDRPRVLRTPRGELQLLGVDGFLERATHPGQSR